MRGERLLVVALAVLGSAAAAAAQIEPPPIA